MKQYKKDDAVTLFPDNVEAQAKFKSMVQGKILAKKELEAENDEALKQMVLDKCKPSAKRAFQSKLMETAKEAKRYISEDDIIKAIEDAYKAKANEAKQQKIEALEAKLQALKESLM